MMQADVIQLLTRTASQMQDGSSDFDLNPDAPRPKGLRLRASAVLIPIMNTNSGWTVLLTKRSFGLKHHPGQISFPGGKQDDEDASLEITALREANEEIGLHPDNVTILGRLPNHETVTGFQVTPILGHIKAQFDLNVAPEEVEEAFTVPLKHVLDISKYSVQYRQWQGQRRNFYTVPWGPYYIWGATARMLYGLAKGVIK